MTLQNTSNLDVKKTIDTTFENAKGWLFAKYPSKQHPESNIQISVQYPESFSADNPSGMIMDFSQMPTILSIRRKQTHILLSRDAFTDLADGKEKVSYSIQIKALGKDYRAIETPSGEVLEQGDLVPLRYVQTDEELKKYITFISKFDKEPIANHSKKWRLDKTMELSRS